MRIMIVTDAWSPQVNGVVRTLQSVRRELEAAGDEVEVISPDLFRSIPCPTYPEIRLALGVRRAMTARIDGFAPDALHIATEGPLGVAARRLCLKRGWPFTTAYHTQFPDYVAKRTKLPPSLFWKYIRWFHRPARATMVSTPSMAAELEAQGVSPTRRWGRGVDLSCFGPDVAPHAALAGLPRPIQLFVGRVAIEKNIEAFLDAAHPGGKVVVGDGPALAALRKRYPDVLFLGALRGAALAGAYAGADVFVFPSRTDTFGLVMIEALACGTPVAAYPVTGPVDVLSDEVGAMDADLDAAIASALTRDRAACARYGGAFTWEASARQFRSALEPFGPADRAPQPVGTAEQQGRAERAGE
ncbi:glycosyltransferase family 4 protein, partial [Sphingosinicella sp.]|uniref:glycosyltransferase family 4 protein n=1 Tax=Sphingosinicella sp. TaxID=1917971 RepID=UPI0040384C53